MQIEQKINNFVLADATIIAIIATRLFPDEAPALMSEPHIVYSTEGPDYIPLLEGVGDLETMEFEYECYSPNRQEVRDLSLALARLFARDTYTQVSGRYPADELWIQCVSSRVGPSSKIPSELATTQPLYWQSVYVTVSYKKLQS